MSQCVCVWARMYALTWAAKLQKDNTLHGRKLTPPLLYTWFGQHIGQSFSLCSDSDGFVEEIT